MCPHKQAFVLSQGIMGSAGDTPKVACPLHKKTFDLHNGQQIGADDQEPLNILTFPVKIEDGKVLVELPATPELDAILGTHGLRVQKSECVDLAADALKVRIKGAAAAANKSASKTALMAEPEHKNMAEE